MGKYPTIEQNQGMRLLLLGTDRYSRNQSLVDAFQDRLDARALGRLLRTGQLTRQVVTSIPGLPRTIRETITAAPEPAPVEFEEQIHLVSIALGLPSPPAGTAAASGPFFFPYVIEEVIFSPAQTGLTVAASISCNLIISPSQRSGGLPTGFGTNPGDSIFHPDSNLQEVRMTEQNSTVILHPHKTVTVVPTTLIFEALSFGGDDIQPTCVVRIRQIGPEKAHEAISKIRERREPPGLTIVPPDVRQELIERGQQDLLEKISTKLDQLKGIQAELRKRPAAREITLREPSDRQRTIETKVQRRTLLELTGRELCQPYPRTIRFANGIEFEEGTGTRPGGPGAQITEVKETRLEGIQRLHQCLLRNPMGIPHSELLAKGFDEDMIAASWQLNKSGSPPVISGAELAARERDVVRKRELQEEELARAREQREALRQQLQPVQPTGGLSGFL